ncbi:MAG: L-2-amino-thiazoline-4-carboxylic acid hydrolase [Deltaproteobacteria bacterium]|nr:L-2-amino-thiazoline-4-carboxylic acid hydrolase [Deltaproteobacteria bacterium]
MTGESDVPLIARRRIEAELIKYIYAELKEELGAGRAKVILGRAIRKAAKDAGAALAAKEPEKPGTRALASLQGLWSAGGALKTKVLELTDDAYAYEVERCGYAAMYAELGMGELGSVVSCLRDASFIEGYAPDLVLDRPETIMDGDGRCLFRYRKADRT